VRRAPGALGPWTKRRLDALREQINYRLVVGEDIEDLLTKYYGLVDLHPPSKEL
jgi:hypothetical protein